MSSASIPQQQPHDARNSHHRIVIVGRGDAGVSAAARLQNTGEGDIAIVEANVSHHYQPLWMLVGGGLVDVRKTVRREASVLPKHTTWIRDSCTRIDSHARPVTTAARHRVSYDRLVLKRYGLPFAYWHLLLRDRA